MKKRDLLVATAIASLIGAGGFVTKSAYANEPEIQPDVPTEAPAKKKAPKKKGSKKHGKKENHEGHKHEGHNHKGNHHDQAGEGKPSCHGEGGQPGCSGEAGKPEKVNQEPTTAPSNE